jgi:cytochrome c oxidase cbb3-type subunit 4
MDINLLRSIVTLLAFLSFLGIVVWAYHRASRPRFEEAANLPFADEADELRVVPIVSESSKRN